jgi:hypothetical protein
MRTGTSAGRLNVEIAPGSDEETDAALRSESPTAAESSHELGAAADAAIGAASEIAGTASTAEDTAATAAAVVSDGCGGSGTFE